MDLTNIRIGVGMTGSFCTFEKSFQVLRELKKQGAVLTAIVSSSVQRVDCRFGKSNEFEEQIREITEQEPMKTIEEAEAVGPKGLFDVYLILPATGNTMAKLANGITDSPVLMGAKAQLRNMRPLVLSLASNDALGMNLKNIGYLLPTKYIYFVPFGQDDPMGKPNSLVAHTNLVVETIKSALSGKQLQPVLRDY